MEYGSRETPGKPDFSSAGKLKICTGCPPTLISVRVLKLFRVAMPLDDTSPVAGSEDLPNALAESLIARR
jgi:hypothetical protein